MSFGMNRGKVGNRFFKRILNIGFAPSEKNINKIKRFFRTYQTEVINDIYFY